MTCAHAQVWWTRARWQCQWAQMAAAALAVGSCGLGGTIGSGHEREHLAAGLRVQWRAGHRSGVARALL